MYFAYFPPKICQSNPEKNVRNKKSFPIFHNCFLIRCESTVSWTVGKSNLFAQKTKLPILLWWTGSESQIVPFKSAILLWTGLTSLGSFFPLLLKISLWRHQQRQFFLFYLSIVCPLFQPSFKSVWRRKLFAHCCWNYHCDVISRDNLSFRTFPLCVPFASPHSSQSDQVPDDYNSEPN